MARELPSGSHSEAVGSCWGLVQVRGGFRLVQEDGAGVVWGRRSEGLTSRLLLGGVGVDFAWIWGWLGADLCWVCGYRIELPLESA